MRATPASALRDAPFTVTLVGLASRERVTIGAEEADAAGKRWRSTLTAEADRSGVARLPSAARLIERMRPPPGDTDSFTPPAFPSPMRIRVSARAGQRMTHVTLVRRQIAPGASARKIDRPGLVGMVFAPADGRRHRAVVVIGGSEGGYETRLPALLASHGFIVLSLAYFDAPGLPKSLVRLPVETVTQGIDFLSSNARVAPGGIYVVGTSRGGELAMLAGLSSGSVRGIVGIVPSPIIFAGLEFGKGPVDASPWTVRGAPVPYITFAQWRAFSATGDLHPITGAFLPLERLKSPLLLIAADDDKLAYSYRICKLAVERLDRIDPRARVTLLHYPFAGHLLDAPYLPTANLSEATTPYGKLKFGGTPEGYAAADRQSWRKLLKFISR